VLPDKAASQIVDEDVCIVLHKCLHKKRDEISEKVKLVEDVMVCPSLPKSV
jgi:hypothetical protein